MQLPLGDPARAQILTVSQLNQRVRDILTNSLADVWVAGEISNFRIPQSGHFYFALKDARCQIPAVMFRSDNQRLPFRPADGMAVVVRGRVSLYDVRGDIQLYVDTIEPRGIGSQQVALEQLKQRLAAEGLFAEGRKRPLPFLPACVGIVTARSGAAIHDMLVTLHNRMPGVRVVLRPVRVQGKEAPPELVAALTDLAQFGACDVIIVGRGGGSLEDLWAFNDERVARAIAACPIPVVSAVGHEIDMTIADLVADRRAATPTAAATLVVPDRDELLGGLAELGRALSVTMLRQIRQQRDAVTARARRLRHPRQAINGLQLRVDELNERANRATAGTLRLAQQQVRAASERLHALSPLAVLQRGYSITRRADSGAVVRAAAALTVGDDLRLLFAEGTALVSVRTTE